MNTISASVGNKGVNRPDDVRAIQALLNAVPATQGGSGQKLPENGLVNAAIINAITRFQRHHQLIVDGRVDLKEGTLKKLKSLDDATELERYLIDNDFDNTIDFRRTLWETYYFPPDVADPPTPPPPPIVYKMSPEQDAILLKLLRLNDVAPKVVLPPHVRIGSNLEATVVADFDNGTVIVDCELMNLSIPPVSQEGAVVLGKVERSGMYSLRLKHGQKERQGVIFLTPKSLDGQELAVQFIDSVPDLEGSQPPTPHLELFERFADKLRDNPELLSQAITKIFTSESLAGFVLDAASPLLCIIDVTPLACVKSGVGWAIGFTTRILSTALELMAPDDFSSDDKIVLNLYLGAGLVSGKILTMSAFNIKANKTLICDAVEIGLDIVDVSGSQIHAHHIQVQNPGGQNTPYVGTFFFEYLDKVRAVFCLKHKK